MATMSDRGEAIVAMLDSMGSFAVSGRCWLSVPDLCAFVMGLPPGDPFARPDGRALEKDTLRVVMRRELMRLRDAGIVDVEMRGGKRGQVVFARLVERRNMPVRRCGWGDDGRWRWR